MKGELIKLMNRKYNTLGLLESGLLKEVILFEADEEFFTMLEKEEVEEIMNEISKKNKIK